MGFEIGQIVGGYEFLDVLSTSHSGIAYKVRNTLAQRLEMLKVLPGKLQDDQERVARFLREIKVHARLQHPNIVSFYNAMELDHQLVMTTELVEGTTLEERIRLGPMPRADVITYGAQVLSALGYAHNIGVIHRDITPENIIIIPDGTIKLTGFGLAKVATDPQLTQVGVTVGPLKYIAPEQIKGTLNLDGRTDIYSLGVVLYEALTGKVPFDFKSQFELMRAHVETAPTPPSEMNPDVSKEFDPVILTALAKEPSERFPSAKDFREALERAGALLEKKSKAAHLDVAELFKPHEAELRNAPAPKPQPARPAEVAPAPPPNVVPAPPMLPRRRVWDSPEIIFAGVFTLLMTALMLFALLAMGKS